MDIEEVDEDVTEIPVHGVAVVEGRATGDGRGFRVGAFVPGAMPQPLGYEFEHGHGSDNSRVAIVGRIDEFFRKEVGDITEVRWRGAIILSKEYAAQAIESIVDGSYTGMSVVVDDVVMDVAEQREQMRERILRDKSMEAGDVEQMLDLYVGDGPVEVSWLSAARGRRVDMVPTGAFQEAYAALGHEFWDEMSEDELEEAVAALAECNCGESLVAAAAPEGAQAEARRGLSWVAEGHGGDGLEPATLDRARKIAAGEDLSDEHVGRMRSFFARHEVDKKGKGWSPDEEGYPSPGRVAWALWGGDPGKSFADSEFERIERERDESSLNAGAFAPGTKDGPGWITNPVGTARIRRYWVEGEGAAKIRWGTPGSFNRCRKQLAKYVERPDWLAGLCANMYKEATGRWPGVQRGDKGLSSDGASPYTLLASAGQVSAEFFRNPNLTRPTGVVVDGDRIYGHIASWNVCHVGNPEGPGVCTRAPRSRSGYAHYLTGTVMTDEGPVEVGSITMNTGHADEYATPTATVAHYDNTGLVVADVACGEDRFGIWFSGRIRPNVSEDDRFALAASGRLSGDWRRIGRDYELIAALVVNSPGFPVPAALAASAGDGIAALIGEGSVQILENSAPVDVAPTDATTEVDVAPELVSRDDVKGIVGEVLEQRERIAQVASVKARARSLITSEVRRRLEEMEA